MKEKLNTSKFIEKAKEIHGDKYDYSKVDYVSYGTKVCIICPKHGEFTQTPCNHLHGKGCPICGAESRVKKRSSTRDRFIEKAKEIHGDKYDYSKVEYVNNYTKVCIICPEHGEFLQTPHAHLSGQDCPKCSHQSFKYTLDEWINKARSVHGEKYDYSKVDYVSNHSKISIICPEHGEFLQEPIAHLRGQGCPKCADVLNGSKRLLGVEKFVERAKIIHGDKYDYSKVDYKRNNEKVCIICPTHGEFWQTPTKHLFGQGCPSCNENKMEEKVKRFLDENSINYNYQYKIDWLKNNNGNALSIDFYLPQYNIGIECQGIQHFKPVEYFGGSDRFLRQIENDKIKKGLCEEHSIKLLYITEKKVKTNIDLYTKDNVVLIDKMTFDKIKNASL